MSLKRVLGMMLASRMGGRRRGMRGKLGLAAMGYMAYRAYQDHQARTGGAHVATSRAACRQRHEGSWPSSAVQIEARPAGTGGKQPFAAMRTKDRIAERAA